MAEGTIKRLVRDRGFGFIRPNGEPTDLFFHRSTVSRPDSFDQMQEGDAVTFEFADSPKGPRAENVRLG